MKFWTCSAGDIRHIPTIGWAVVKDTEVVLIEKCLINLFKKLEG